MVVFQSSVISDHFTIAHKICDLRSLTIMIAETGPKSIYNHSWSWSDQKWSAIPIISVNSSDTISPSKWIYDEWWLNWSEFIWRWRKIDIYSSTIHSKVLEKLLDGFTASHIIFWHKKSDNLCAILIDNRDKIFHGKKYGWTFQNHTTF